MPKVCKAVQVLALDIFKLRAEVPPREIGEVPTVIEPELVSPIVELVKEALAIPVRFGSVVIEDTLVVPMGIAGPL